MSRKPSPGKGAEVARRLPGRRGVWAAVRELGSFTEAELRLLVPHVAPANAHSYLTLLIKGGYVVTGPLIDGPGPDARKVRLYSLARDIGVDAPRLRKDGTEAPTTLQQRMWLAMKILGTFSARDLSSAATTEERAIPVATAETYIRRLAVAGYLTGENGGPYRLVKDTGGHAPVIQRANVVYDPNLNRVVWHEDIEP